jgi:hypothetical protein
MLFLKTQRILEETRPVWGEIFMVERYSRSNIEKMMDIMMAQVEYNERTSSSS